MTQQPPTYPYLVMLQSGRPFRVFPLRKSVLTIGRAPNNDIVIMDRRVSRYHARLNYQQGDWLLEDLNSDNGVWVNGIRVAGPTFVADDSIISLGQSVNFELELKPDPPQGVPERKFFPGWVRAAGLFGIGGMGLLIIGVVLLALLAVLAYFAFGFAGNVPWIEIQWTNAQPTAAAQIAQVDQDGLEAPIFQLAGAPDAVGAQLGIDAFPTRGPEVTIQEPLPDLFVPLGGSFQVQASAYDNQGVVRMDLWVDDQLALSQTVKPGNDGLRNFFLSQAMIGANEGVYALTVRAYNSQGVMGESPAYNITISKDIEPEPVESVQYIVQNGDSLASIASSAGLSQQAVQDANPGMDAISGAGQIISLPNPQMGAIIPPSAEPASLLGLNPVVGLNPVAAGQMAEVQPDLQSNQNVSQVLTAFLPDPGQSLGLPQKPPPAPTDLKAQINNCKVTLQWKYGSKEASNLIIYRRYTPGQPAYQHIAVIPATATAFIETLGTSGKYEYVVEAVGELKPANSDSNSIQDLYPGQKWTMETSRSLPLKVDVNPSGGCVQDPDKLKVLFFQPVNFASHDADVIKANIWYGIPGGISRRIPAGQSQFLHVGGWSVAPELIPLPPQIFLNPNNAFMFGAWAQGETWDSFHNNKPFADLGRGFVSVNPKDIQNQPNKTMNLIGDSFALELKLWIAEQRWTGLGYTAPGASSAPIPAPTNLKEANQGDANYYRMLTWDWSGDKKTIDGFILYRTFSCPGQKALTRSPMVIPVSGKGQGNWAQIDKRNEPAGCGFKYQVSAFGRYGESAVSKPVEGQTQSTYTDVTITFKDLNISNLPAGNPIGQFDLAVNQYHHQTDTIALQTGRYNLSGVFIAGDLPNNSYSVKLGEDESARIHFYVNHVKNGRIIEGGICSGFIHLSPPDQWASPTSTYTINSISGGPCTVNVEVSRGVSTTPTGGQTIKPQADLQIWNVARVGKAVYAEIGNRGPDDLTNANIFLAVYSGRYCADTGDFTDKSSLYSGNSWAGMTAGNAGWFHISKVVDDYVDRYKNNPQSPSSTLCPPALWVEVWPDANTPDTLIDPDTTNDDYKIAVRSIKPR
jgi:LysM repeat protein